MILKFHGLVGKLVANLSSSSTTMMVTEAMAQRMAVSFDNGYTQAYFAVVAGSAYEVVRVDAVEGNVLSIGRGIDGSEPQAFPVGATVLHTITSEGIKQDIMDAGGIQQFPILEGQGITSVVLQGDTFLINTPAPEIVGRGGVEVVGQWPNLMIAYAGGECCDGNGNQGGGSSDGVNIDLQTSGILDGYAWGTTLYLGVAAPIFNGQNGITVSGSWPYYNISAANMGQGTVTGVGVGNGLTLTGSPNVNPTISISNTGVAAGTYGDIQINARGQVTNVANNFDPISHIVSADNTVQVTRQGGQVTLDVAPAGIGVPGVVALADETSPFNPADTETAATPAVVAAGLATIKVSQADGVTSILGQSDGDYTNIIGASSVPLQLAQGQKALVIANTTAADLGNPTLGIAYGLGVFNTGPAKVQANRIVPQSQQTLVFLVQGPMDTAISIATTPLPSGATITGYSLNVVKF